MYLISFLNGVWIFQLHFYNLTQHLVVYRQKSIWNHVMKCYNYNFPLPKSRPIRFEIKRTQDFQIFSFKTIRAFNNLMYWCSETNMMDMIHWEPINKKYISIYVHGGNEMRWMFFFKSFFTRNVLMMQYIKNIC